MTAIDILADMTQSEGAISDLTNAQRIELRSTFLSDLYLFSLLIMQNKEMDANLHGELANLIESWGQPNRDRLMIQIPRGHFKSSLCTVANATWQIFREPDKPVVIINANEDNTSNWLRAIRAVIAASPWVWTLFKDILPPGVSKFDSRSRPQAVKWNDYHLEFEGRRIAEPEASISGYGLYSAKAGHHWPKTILDDLIGERERDSLMEMERSRNFIKTHTALMRPTDSGWSLVPCTPWGYQDTYTTMLEYWDYKLYRRAALERPNREASLAGDPIFPAQFTRERLLKLYAANPTSFLSQYQCNPIPGEEQAFDKAWLRWFEVIGPEDEPKQIVIDPESYLPMVHEIDEMIAPRIVKLSQLEIAAFLDPAPAEGPEKKASPGARNGICVIGKDAWDRTFILEAFGTLERPIDVIHHLFRLAKKWGFYRVFIEKVNFSALYAHWILNLQDRGHQYQDHYLAPMDVDPERQNKDKRILDKVNGWEVGKFYLNTKSTEDFYQEYCEYSGPNSPRRDILDAFAYEHKLSRPLRDDELEFSRMGLQRLMQNGHDFISGY